MSSLRQYLTKAPIRQSIRPSIAPRRCLTTTNIRQTDPPPGNQAPSTQQHGRTSQPADDAQSSASTQMPEEHNTGDDHPAKQPDTQVASESSTGFMENQKGGEVKGGKEGLDQRSDKQ